MSQFRKTPDGMIDYDFYKKDANRLRREARNRFVDRLVSGAGWAICLPFRQVMRFAAAWQALICWLPVATPTLCRIYRH